MPEVVNKPRRPLGAILKALVAVIAVGTLGYFAYTITRPTLLEFLVYDQQSGEPLADTQVQVQNANGQKLMDLVTDAKGWAGVKRLIPATGYRVVARHLDYVLAERRNLEVRLHKTTTARLPLRSKPGGRLYIGMQRGYIAVLDTASYLFVNMKRGPEGLGGAAVQQIVRHPQQPWLYVGSQNKSYKLNEANFEPLAELEVSGSVISLALDAQAERLLAAVVTNRLTLVSLDPNSGEALGSILVQGAATGPQVIFEHQGQLAYLTYSGNFNFVNVLDLASSRSATRIPIGFRPTWALLSPDDTQLFCGRYESGQIARVDVAQRQVVQTVTLSPGLSARAIHPDGTQLYLANDQLGSLLIVDAATLQTLAQVPVGRKPAAIVLDALGERAYIANAESQDISVMDIKLRQIIETIPLEVSPVSLAVR